MNTNKTPNGQSQSNGEILTVSQQSRLPLFLLTLWTANVAVFLAWLIWHGVPGVMP
ncbi:MAG TPA: hypothetical protein VLU94_00990 [Candidatus Nitrosotalea sp.]|nr:hypothetical protein [Candidatus Nitrosotalea sp.]